MAAKPGTDERRCAVVPHDQAASRAAGAQHAVPIASQDLGLRGGTSEDVGRDEAPAPPAGPLRRGLRVECGVQAQAPLERFVLRGGDLPSVAVIQSHPALAHAHGGQLGCTDTAALAAIHRSMSHTAPYSPSGSANTRSVTAPDPKPAGATACGASVAGRPAIASPAGAGAGKVTARKPSCASRRSRFTRFTPLPNRIRSS
ncbi:hypothetical protein BFJ72_g14764 [Fusarium proliferatum]|uniref:Uncharacterized protein n=1 Tax=Gibberella intermedia TaxID=948311 RepID=A0A420RYG6_GIBIN|nr:hypothetical protein BFJ72_g14764 [Fusarium proliferatum]